MSGGGDFIYINDKPVYLTPEATAGETHVIDFNLAADGDGVMTAFDWLKSAGKQ